MNELKREQRKLINQLMALIVPPKLPTGTAYKSKTGFHICIIDRKFNFKDLHWLYQIIDIDFEPPMTQAWITYHQYWTIEKGTLLPHHSLQDS